MILPAAADAFSLAGPVLSLDNVTQVLIARLFIWLPNCTANETWGMNWTWTGGCDLCYNASTGWKNWGMSVATLNFTELTSGNSSQLELLGYAPKQSHAREYPIQPRAYSFICTQEPELQVSHLNLLLSAFVC